MKRRKSIWLAEATAAAVGAALMAALGAGESGMRMTAVEKYFVNSPGHTVEVARQAQELLDKVPVETGWKYLDVGCGVAGATREIARSRPLRVTGVDIDPEQIAAARKGSVRANLEFHTMDATRLQYPDAAFDVVATSRVTHHIPQWEQAFGEMGRVVRPGGYLIYNDFVLPEWLSGLGRRMVRQAGFPTEERIGALARRVGLTEVYRSRSLVELNLIWRKSG